MLLKDVITRIRFNTATTDDLSGNTLQDLFTNQSIITQLQFSLDKYANHTKALEDIFYTQCFNTTNVVTPPSDVLRSQGVRFIIIYNKGLRYPIIEKNFNNVFGQFYVQNVVGIPGWFLYFTNQIQLYPTNSLNPLSSTLATAVGATDSTITLTSSISVPLRNGCINIDNEKISYLVNSTINNVSVLTGCTRGVNNTTAAAHLQGAPVTENNCLIFYYKRHWEAVVYSDDVIDPIYANRVMDVTDEHLEVIIDYVSFKLLAKVDPQRAGLYKNNFDQWLDDAKYDIQKGRTNIRAGESVREAYWFENDDNAYRYF